MIRSDPFFGFLWFFPWKTLAKWRRLLGFVPPCLRTCYFPHDSIIWPYASKNCIYFLSRKYSYIVWKFGSHSKYCTRSSAQLDSKSKIWQIFRILNIFNHKSNKLQPIFNILNISCRDYLDSQKFNSIVRKTFEKQLNFIQKAK